MLFRHHIETTSSRNEIIMKLNSIWQPKQSRVLNQLDFNIGDPSLYHCSLLKYLRPHRQLVIAVHEKKTIPSLSFTWGLKVFGIFRVIRNGKV